jgi:hypothetical protein
MADFERLTACGDIVLAPAGLTREGKFYDVHAATGR